MNQSASSLGALLVPQKHFPTDLTNSVQSTYEFFVHNLKMELDAHIVGQDEAKQALVDTVITGLYNIHREQGALGAVFLGGPTGVGKTELTRALARVLLGNPDGFVKITAEKFLHEADISSGLYGASAGYVGYGDTPMLADERVHAAYKEAKEKKKLHPLLSEQYNAMNFSIVLVDEIEKGHPALALAFLNLLQSGQAEMSSGKEGSLASGVKKEISHSRYTDLHNTLFIFTSNIGEHDIAASRESSIGFVADSGRSEKGDKREFELKVKKAFPPEFVGRLNHIVRCHALTHEQMQEVFQIHVDRINRALDEQKYFQGMGVRVTPVYADHMLSQKSKEIKKYGARPIARIVDIIGTKVGIALNGSSLPKDTQGNIVFDIGDNKKEIIQYVPHANQTRFPAAVLTRSMEQHVKMVVEGKINHRSSQVRETVREYLKHITNYDTGFRDACRILEKRLRGYGFNTQDINELRAMPFCSLYETMIQPENGDILVRDGANFGPIGFRAIEKYLRSAIKNDFKLQDIYTTITVLLKRPLTQMESQVLAQYIHRLVQSRNAKRIK